MNNFYYLILVTFIVLFSACREDVLIEQEPPDEIPMEIPVFREANLEGRIVDETGVPIVGARILAGDNETYTSNDYGFFTINKVLAPENGLYLKVQKEGYFVGGDHYYPVRSEETLTGEIIITLAELPPAESFESNEGVTIDFDQAQLSIPANAISKDGAAYTGTVNAYVKYLDPSENSTIQIMPGDLIARNGEGSLRGLRTFGMIAVELEDANGEALNLDSSKEASLTFPLSTQIQSDAPDEIALWHFDETDGIWLQEGTANREGDSYKALVNHFSWWNCDIPIEITNLCVNFLTETGAPIQHLEYCMSAPSLGTVCRQLLGQNQICGPAPLNEIITISFLDDCGIEFHSVDIGPFSGPNDEANVNVIFPDSYEIVTVSGTLTDCEDNPLESGFMSLSYLGKVHVDNTLENGDYSINVLLCDPAETEVNLRAVDMVDFLEAESTFDLDPSTNAYVQDLSVCGSEVSQQMVVTIGGTTYTFLACEAKQSKAETLIIAGETSIALPGDVALMVGTKGFEKGDFKGNIYVVDPNIAVSPAVSELDLSDIIFDSYEQVGGKVSGSFDNGEISGSFIAKRTR